MQIPAERLHLVHDTAPDASRRYVLYWMTEARRPCWNFALDRAAEWARELRKPLLVLETLYLDNEWASDRMHRFVLDGMRDNASAFGKAGVGYYPYVEVERGDGRGLLAAVSQDAAVLVTDRPALSRRRLLVTAAARQISTRFEEVDGSGLLPVDVPPSDLVFQSAYAFRRFLQRVLTDHLTTRPGASGVSAGELTPPAEPPTDVQRRWPRAQQSLLDGRDPLTTLRIDHSVPPASLTGGHVAASQQLAAFLDRRVAAYHEDRQHPDRDAGSGLSPYLHFGHISSHEIVTRLLRQEGWKPAKLASTTRGARDGWWGVSPGAEAFLDQVVTWRELGFNMCARRTDYDAFESLPAWALATLDTHAADRRPAVYTLDEFAAAATHDPLWNAAQRQLSGEGRLHNYLRMLWGKKILEWTSSPRAALAVMIELNNRLALDGQDPNSYSGIFWVLGRYDRPWPERPVFGTVRCMTSESTMRKIRVREYLRRYSASPLDF